MTNNKISGTRCGCLRMERARQATAHDLFGQIFGELKVVGRSRKRTKMGACRTCLCICGYTCEATAAELMSRHKAHCGCKSVKNYASADITCRRFGRLTAQYSTKKRDTKGFVIWHCRCDCGNARSTFPTTTRCIAVSRAVAARRRNMARRLPDILFMWTGQA